MRNLERQNDSRRPTAVLRAALRPRFPIPPGVVFFQLLRHRSVRDVLKPIPQRSEPLRGAVFLSIFDWWTSSHGHSDIQLARAFARRMPVLFVNSIGMRLPHPGNASAPLRRITRKLRGVTRPLAFPDPNLNLAVISPFSLPIYTGMAEFFIRHLLKFQIQRSLRRINVVNPIIFVTVPTFANVANEIPHERIFYYRSDRHSAFPGARSETVLRYEDSLFQRSDMVLYSSRSLFESEAHRLNGRARLIGHGVDASIFTPAGAEAAELSDLPRPLVGFFGELRERAVDFDLIIAVAQLCPSVHFVLGGMQLDDLSRLQPYPNIHLVEACSHERMPERWRSLDAAILPYKLNSWSEGIEPIKLAEIFATGLRAVGTPVPALKGRPDAVAIARSPIEFAAALQDILASQAGDRAASRATRRQKTLLNSWDSIAEDIIAASRSRGAPLQERLEQVGALA